MICKTTSLVSFTQKKTGDTSLTFLICVSVLLSERRQKKLFEKSNWQKKPG